MPFVVLGTFLLLGGVIAFCSLPKSGTLSMRVTILYPWFLHFVVQEDVTPLSPSALTTGILFSHVFERGMESGSREGKVGEFVAVSVRREYTA